MRSSDQDVLMQELHPVSTEDASRLLLEAEHFVEALVLFLKGGSPQ